MKKSVTIKAAWITAGAIVLAALIGGGFALFGSGDIEIADSGNQISNSPMAMAKFHDNQFRDFNITYTTSGEDTKLAIAALEEKLNSTSSEIKLTRNEVSLLSRALKDLDDRTSGIEKLPDGRTKFGHLVSGQPHYVISEHHAAIEDFNAQKYREALNHSKNAIEAYEASQGKSSMSTGNLNPENVAKVYLLGVRSAHQLNDAKNLKEWSEKALKHNPKLGKKEDS